VGDVDRQLVESILTAEAVGVEYVLDVVGYRDEISADGSAFSASIDLLIEGEENASKSQTITVTLNNGD
jgi:hypothetical protein